MGSSVILPAMGQPREGPDPSFVTPAIPNVVQFAFLNIAPPSALYMQRDDFVLINVVSNTPNEVVQGELRWLLPNPPQPGQPDTAPGGLTNLPHVGPGEIKTTLFTIATGAPLRVAATKTFSMGEGFLLSVSMQATNAVQRGQTYARATLNRGGGTGLISTVAQTLVTDYVTNQTSIGWPGGRQQQSQEGVGFLHSVNQPNPAAGADFTFTVPASARMRVGSFAAIFTASVAAANRNVQIIIDDGTAVDIYWIHDLAVSITAGQTINVAGTTTNSPTGIVTTIQSVVLPPNLVLPVGHRLRSQTQNIQAGDQWSAIWFGMEEWLDAV